MFDAESFMNSSMTEANETKMEPIPVGEYSAVIKEVKLEGKTNPKTNEPMYPLDITWEITDSNLQAALGRDNIQIRQTVYLDINSSGKLEMGKNKNVGLGKLRAALNMNKPGVPFSPLDLRGAGPALIMVSQTPKKDDPDIIYSNVKSVGRLS